MKQWNFGIVGAGLIADFHARAIKALDNAKLVGICGRTLSKVEALAEKHNCRVFEDYKELAADEQIDIVTIATPSGFHLEPTVAAAEAGKHVLCEKPLEITLERIDKMIAAHKKSGTLLGGIFQNRFTEPMTPLKDAINQGRFGVVTYAGIYVPWWRQEEYYKDSWHGTLALDGGGAMMNQSIHMVDMLCDLMPEIESIQGFVNHIGHPQIETEDTAVATVRFKGGALGIIYGTTASWPGQFKRFEITGTKGTVVYLENSLTVWQFADERPEDKEIREKYGQVAGGGGVSDPGAIPCDNHIRNFRAFVESLEKGEDFCINAREARKAVEVVLAIYQSAKENRPIKLS